MSQQIECVTNLTTIQFLGHVRVIVKQLLEIDRFEVVSSINQFGNILFFMFFRNNFRHLRLKFIGGVSEEGQTSAWKRAIDDLSFLEA